MTTLYRKGNQVSIELPVDKLAPEYPDKFFGRREKPKVVVPNYASSTTALCKSIKSDIKTRHLTTTGVKVFLYEISNTLSVTLDDDWESFNIQIGRQGEDINPMSLVRVERHGEYESTASEDFKEDDTFWMYVFCCGLYRIGKITDSQYQSKIVGEIDKIMKGSNKDSISLAMGIELSLQIVNDINYCKLIAAIDMFFYKNKNHKFSPVRIGTISSRYRDCAALLGINHLAMLAGGSVGLGIQWALETSVQDDIDRLIHPGQETSNVGSYTPYMMDFGASVLSPYSTTANAAFHLYVHAIGSLNLDPRSMNARFIPAPNVSGIIQNAAFFVYATGKSVEWNIGFTEDDETPKAGMSREPKLSVGGHPKTKKVRDWMNWREANKDRFDEIMTSFLRDRASRLGAARSGSVGAYIKATYERP
ncbi:nucleoprotein [Ouango virus]|uniref:Nucleoprotein n=1 Tax=Ouango virus TaxID=864692 RepID=A0AAE8XFW0_9RHAB|nr:nucleoprotein [Ouango virus]UAU42887.1 nucleoprotein [Ouango virus]